MTNQQGAPEALRTITRYEVVDCIDSKHVPAVIPNKDGPWVRYEDHLAALVEAQQPAPSAAVAEIEGGPPGSGGWEKHAIEMERQRDYYRQRCHTMEEHQNGGVWYWQGDDGDSLESMGNSMLVVIRADQLRSLMQPSPTPQADQLQPIVALQESAGMYADDFAPQADSQPAPVLDSLALMKVVMRADEALAGRCTRGTTNWAAAIGKAVQDAVLTARAPADSVTAPAYSIDADPQGIRARVADAITGALAFGAQGTNAPPDGHWLAPFWAAARAEREAAPVADLHPKTSALVQRFAAALTEKLAAAEKKYGYSDGWASPDWMGECRQKLVEHLAKGDPRDVAAYCAFLWHHRESTTAPASQGDALDAARYRFLRDGEWRDTDLEPFIRLQLNTLWDAKIDAARAAQEGKA